MSDELYAQTPIKVKRTIELRKSIHDTSSDDGPQYFMCRICNNCYVKPGTNCKNCGHKYNV